MCLVWQGQGFYIQINIAALNSFAEVLDDFVLASIKRDLPETLHRQFSSFPAALLGQSLMPGKVVRGALRQSNAHGVHSYTK